MNQILCSARSDQNCIEKIKIKNLLVERKSQANVNFGEPYLKILKTKEIICFPLVADKFEREAREDDIIVLIFSSSPSSSSQSNSNSLRFVADYP